MCLFQGVVMTNRRAPCRAPLLPTEVLSIALSEGPDEPKGCDRSTVHRHQPVLCLLVVCGPLLVEIGQGLLGKHPLLALTFVEQFLDATARGHQHLMPRNQIGLFGERAMAGHDFGIIV
jgi:hypothetical protein